MAVTVHGETALEIEDPGEIITDRFGLETATLSYKIKAATQAERALVLAGTIPRIGDAHPLASYLKLVRVRKRMDPGLMRFACDFEGVAEDTEPIYTLEAGLSEEPIETHRSFRFFAGKPSEPQNGAIFTDSSGAVTTDDAEGVFSGFAPYLDPLGTGFATPNYAFGGVTAYLNFSKAVWKMVYFTPNRPQDAYQALGRINTPPGQPPQFLQFAWGVVSQTRNYLYMGMTMEQRGGAYKVEHGWMLSDVGGWNGSIYGYAFDDVVDE